MPRAIFIFVLMAGVSGPEAGRAAAQAHSLSELRPAPAIGGTQTVDGVAARIESDILTESEVRELAAFQKLVEGRAKARSELIRELADQWIVRGEARTAKFSRPSQADVDRAYAQLVKQFASPQEFEGRCTSAGITEAVLRTMLEQQLYLSQFLDYRFRPAAQVDRKQVEDYYRDEFAPQLKARGQPVPPLEDVQESIREVLVQRAISERATQWLDATRERLKIDVVSPGGDP
jgi:hypothetical protein